MLSEEQKKNILTIYNKKKNHYRNLAIIAHVDHGKTTLSDSLIATGGLINPDAAGSMLVLDNTEIEKKRGITINSSVISYFYKDHLFNLVDTPGHTDFNAQVVKSLRNVDSAILVVDCLEGLMPQTEVVLLQALNENLDIILCVNKFDRLIKEMCYPSTKIAEVFIKNVSKINELIATKKGKEDSKYLNYFDVKKNVVFGSALKGWGMTLKSLKENNVNFQYVIDNIDSPTLSKEHPIAPTLLNTLLECTQGPAVTQKNKIKALYEHQEENNIVNLKELENCDQEGPFIGVVTDVLYNVSSTPTALTRIFSGTLSKKQEIYSSEDNFEKPVSVQKLNLIMNRQVLELEKGYAGSVVAITGLKDFKIGTTLSTIKEVIPFPNLLFSREPNVMLAIKPQKSSNIVPMLEGISKLSAGDPCLKVEQNDETKEIVLYGVGALHLEVAVSKLEALTGLKIIVSEKPQVSLGETITQDSIEVSTRSPNKHNDFKLILRKIPDQLTTEIVTQNITIKTPQPALIQKGIPKDIVKKIKAFYKNGSYYVDNARGALYMQECKEILEEAIGQSLKRGTILGKPLRGVSLELTFAKLHEDARHRQYSQIFNAIREGVVKALNTCNPFVIQPGIHLTIDTPFAYAGEVIKELNKRAGQLLETKDANLEGYSSFVFEIPLSRTFDLAPVLMSLTKGRAFWTTTPSVQLKLPSEILNSYLKEETKK